MIHIVILCENEQFSLPRFRVTINEFKAIKIVKEKPFTVKTKQTGVIVVIVIDGGYSGRPHGG